MPKHKAQRARDRGDSIQENPRAFRAPEVRDIVLRAHDERVCTYFCPPPLENPGSAPDMKKSMKVWIKSGKAETYNFFNPVSIEGAIIIRHESCGKFSIHFVQVCFFLIRFFYCPISYLSCRMYSCLTYLDVTEEICPNHRKRGSHYIFMYKTICCYSTIPLWWLLDF